MDLSSSVLANYYKFDVSFCYPYVDALIRTLEMTCNINSYVSRPYLKEGEVNPPMDVVISVTLTSDFVAGCIAICFPKKVFLGIVKRMTGESSDTITQDHVDAAKELINIVFNQARKPLLEKGIDAARAVPLIITGGRINLDYLNRGQIICLPIESTLGGFHLELAMESKT